jgi:hypothetical protein
MQEERALQLAVVPPGTWKDAQEMEHIEESFSDVLSSLMRRRISAHGAVARWECVCLDEAARLQDQAIAHMHIPSRSAAYAAKAQSMWEECCTWKLMRCLFCECAPISYSMWSAFPPKGDTDKYSWHFHC